MDLVCNACGARHYSAAPRLQLIPSQRCEACGGELIVDEDGHKQGAAAGEVDRAGLEPAGPRT